MADPSPGRSAGPPTCARSLVARPTEVAPRPTPRDGGRRLPLVDRGVLPLPLAVVDLTRPGDRLLVVVDELEPLSDPARGTRDGEDDREHLRRHADRLVDQARVVVDVRVQLSLGEELVVERPLLELRGDLELGALPGHLEHLVDVLLDDPRARVVVLVHAVPEAHEALLAVLHARKEVPHVLRLL